MITVDEVCLSLCRIEVHFIQNHADWASDYNTKLRWNGLSANNASCNNSGEYCFRNYDNNDKIEYRRINTFGNTLIPRRADD